MADHVPAPASYAGEWPESPLTKPDRQQLRTAIRQLRRGRIDECEFTVDTHPAITTLELSYADVDAGLALDVYVVEDALDVDIIANERCDVGGLVTLNDDPHFLRDLGECWHHLEADLITQLCTVLDLPTAVEALVPYTVAPVGLQCTTVRTGSLACFASIFFDSSDTHATDEPV